MRISSGSRTIVNPLHWREIGWRFSRRPGRPGSDDAPFEALGGHADGSIRKVSWSTCQLGLAPLVAQQAPVW
jgi:hypothetical protein